MRVKSLCLISLGAIFLPLIAMAQDVSYNCALDVNFAEFKTYKWVNIGDAKTLDQIVDKDINQAIEAQLMSKGLTQSEEGAQLLVSYRVIVTQEKQITTFSTGGDWISGPGSVWPYGYGSVYGGPSIATATTSTIHIANLILDMYDAGKNDLVWRGGSVQRAEQQHEPGEKSKDLNKAIAKLLNYYPPKLKK